MPDEVSHILWTYLVLKHPKVREKIHSSRDVTATYFFTILPDLGNLVLIVVALWVMVSNNLPVVMGPAARNYPEVSDVFTGPLRNIYYIHHSYVTFTILLALSYLLLKRIYWPLVVGMGLGITLDIPTHRDLTALKPFYPLLDLKVNGVVHWGSWAFYITEAVLIAAYTIWLYRRRQVNQFNV